MTTARSWNPRYMEYCRVNGETDPDKMLVKDEVTWPGGKMCGFTLWICKKWTLWGKATGWKSQWPKGKEQHKGFDLWLASQKS